MDDNSFGFALNGFLDILAYRLKTCHLLDDHDVTRVRTREDHSSVDSGVFFGLRQFVTAHST